MLWTCINLPNLALDVFHIGADDSRAYVVTDSDHKTIIALNRQAQKVGIKTLMSLSAAYARSPDLKAHHRKPTHEINTLKQTALYLMRYSPHVSISMPNSVLIEIGASIKLFKDARHLHQSISQDIKQLGFNAVITSAPTPLAATWLTECGVQTLIHNKRELASHLDRLPLSLIKTQDNNPQAFQAVGMRTIGEVKNISRASIAQRWGYEVLQQIDKAYGNAPDPQKLFELPQQFQSKIPLNFPATSVEEIVFGVNRLIQQMCQYLSNTKRGVSCFKLNLLDENLNPHRYSLKLSSPSRDAKHLIHIVKERLNQESIPSRIEEIQINTETTESLSPESKNLFTDINSKSPIDQTLIDLLSARIGEHCVYGIDTNPDHRPEYAWKKSSPKRRRQHHTIHNRPTWLLAEPKLLSTTSGTPQLRGPLKLIEGPERIETGWWDTHHVRRDYFLAMTQNQSRVWIYQDLSTRSWFLHGIFS